MSVRVFPKEIGIWLSRDLPSAMLTVIFQYPEGPTGTKKVKEGLTCCLFLNQDIIQLLLPLHIRVLVLGSLWPLGSQPFRLGLNFTPPASLIHQLRECISWHVSSSIIAWANSYQKNKKNLLYIYVYILLVLFPWRT